MKKENRIIQEDNDSTYDHVLKYTGLFGGVQGLTILMSVVRNKLVALLLGPSGTGLINMFNSITLLLNQSTNMGIPISGVKRMAELAEGGDRAAIADYAKTIRTWSVLAGLFGTLLCCSLAGVISFHTFNSYDYTLDICLLSPIVAMLAVSGGELAILRGLKQLKKVALVSVFGAFATIIVCVPVYSLLGIHGVVLSLLLCNAAVMAISIYLTVGIVPWHINIRSKRTLMDGGPMLRLGIGYILAGVFGQGAEYIIRTLIIEYSDIAQVGLYNCGYVMMVSYVSIVFVTFDADFFPRLSAASGNTVRSNNIINQQMEVCVLLISPILIMFVLAMPYVVQVLYSSEYLAAVPMSISALLFMFFQALTKPVAYLTLARGDSRMFMFTELIYNIFIATAIPWAFRHYGLMGAGWAITVGGLMDLLTIHIIYRFKYGYRFSTRLSGVYLLQFVLLASTILTALFSSPFLKWGVGAVALAISAYVSLRILRKETKIIDTIVKKIRKRRG